MEGNKTRLVAGNKVIQNIAILLHDAVFKYENVFNEVRSSQLGAVGEL